MNGNDRKIIYICSPCRGNVAVNVGWAKFYTELVLRSGHTPVTPHAFYTEWLDDNNPQDRATALAVGISLLHRCDEVWVFGDRITDGMQKEIAEALTLDIPVRQAKLYCVCGGGIKTKALSMPIQIELMEV